MHTFRSVSSRDTQTLSHLVPAEMTTSSLKALEKKKKASVSEDVNLTPKWFLFPLRTWVYKLCQGPQKNKCFMLVEKLRARDVILENVFASATRFDCGTDIFDKKLSLVQRQLWQLCTITNLLTMWVKGYMSRGNQVGLEKACIPVYLRCSCMAAAGPARNT